jgi:hypothetical protein
VSSREDSGSGRIAAVRAWLARRADSSVGRLAFQWFQRYLESSRNSGSAATVYSILSIFPATLAGIAFFHWSGGDTNAFAQRLIDHQRLTGQTADLVRQMFGTASSNALAASFAALIGFLFWGIGIAPIVQRLYASAWRIEAGSAADQVRYVIWFVVTSAAFAAYLVGAEKFSGSSRALLVLIWALGSTAYWLWTPRFLLHRQIGTRRLLPGALLATFVTGGAILTSPLWISPTLNANGRAFGAFGVALGIFAYAFIMITMSLACAVFAPVWLDWRESERARRAPAGIDAIGTPG